MRHLESWPIDGIYQGYPWLHGLYQGYPWLHGLESTSLTFTCVAQKMLPVRMVRLFQSTLHPVACKIPPCPQCCHAHLSVSAKLENSLKFKLRLPLNCISHCAAQRCYCCSSALHKSWVRAMLEQSKTCRGEVLVAHKWSWCCDPCWCTRFCPCWLDFVFAIFFGWVLVKVLVVDPAEAQI